jgi:hypothetical protein
MNGKQQSTMKKTALFGGIIGVVFCVLLFIFYIFVYFPIFSTENDDTDPSWLYLPPTITGHTFVLLSPFLFEASPIVDIACKAESPSCLHWMAGNIPGCTISKTELDDSGTPIPGCCMKQIMVPDESCRERSGLVGIVILSVLLALIYFLIGALVAWIIRKRR